MLSGCSSVHFEFTGGPFLGLLNIFEIFLHFRDFCVRIVGIFTIFGF